ncbi:hypothetical protein [Mucilaginibacter sp. PAMB04168]|uniref:hypothetical protein n=1 Tax=Mucilaginibacter sp. PAMB04168 TaxID=3138567 RepID=UPI0031F649E4
MRLKLSILCLLMLPFIAEAQYGKQVISGPSDPVYVYLGTLPQSDANNYSKIKVDIFGGAWESFASGETTFFIANRNELIIKQVTQGSMNAGRYSLKGYTNANNGMDFYLQTNSWTAIAVKSCVIGNNPTQLVENTVSANLPSGLTEITPLNIQPVFITDHDGNIGINTATPDNQFKLSVNGKLRAKEIKVETGWADYVFLPGYRLRSLQEVGDHIKANGHLPEVPSAAEVAKNGIQVGETNALLLKKIEELTLYLIDQNKQLLEQKARSIRQEKALKRQQAELSDLRKKLSCKT